MTMTVVKIEQLTHDRPPLPERIAALPPVRVEADVGLADCLAEINNALNYWYPLKGDASEDERNARHVRLFQFRDRLAKQLKANSTHDGQRIRRTVDGIVGA